jgi:adenylosuccinate synthase
VDYLDFSNKLAKSFTDLTDQAKDFISALEERTEVPVTLIGTGPDIDEIIDLRVSEASRKLASREVKTAGRRVAV